MLIPKMSILLTILFKLIPFWPLLGQKLAFLVKNMIFVLNVLWEVCSNLSYVKMCADSKYVNLLYLNFQIFTIFATFGPKNRFLGQNMIFIFNVNWEVCSKISYVKMCADSKYGNFIDATNKILALKAILVQNIIFVINVHWEVCSNLSCVKIYVCWFQIYQFYWPYFSNFGHFGHFWAQN